MPILYYFLHGHNDVLKHSWSKWNSLGSSSLGAVSATLPRLVSNLWQSEGHIERISVVYMSGYGRK